MVRRSNEQQRDQCHEGCNNKPDREELIGHVPCSSHECRLRAASSCSTGRRNRAENDRRVHKRGKPRMLDSRRLESHKERQMDPAAQVTRLLLDLKNGDPAAVDG